MSSASRNNPAKRKTLKGSLKGGPPFSGESSDLPANYVVRATPQTSVSKSLRQIRRIYLHQAVLKAMSLMIGDLVVISHEVVDAAEDEDRISTAFGIAWPSNNLEINCVQMHTMLRQSHLIYEGDRVRLSRFKGNVKYAKEITVCCIEERRPPTQEDNSWRSALNELLPEIRYITEGMEFECSLDGKICSFTVTSIIQDTSVPVTIPHRAKEEMIKDLGLLSLESLGSRDQDFSKKSFSTVQDSAFLSDEEELALPDLFLFEDVTIVQIQHRPHSSGLLQSPRVGSPRPSTVKTDPPSYRDESPRQSNGSSTKPSVSSPLVKGKKDLSRPSTPKLRTEQSKGVTPKNAASASKDRPKIEEINSDEELEIVKESRMPKISYDAIGGLAAQIASLREVVELPLQRPHVFARFNMSPPRGVLLYGPPGTGKTMLLRAVANETSAKVFTISGPSIISKYMGEAEEKLRKLWREAEKAGPSIIFIDEVDAITPKREADSSEAESRIVASLLTLMDGMDAKSKVVVIGATNRPNSIDPALRRPGRFDREIEIGIPDAKARLEILRVMLHDIPHRLSDEFIESVASKTHGFVGADLSAVCRESVLITIKQGLKAGIPEGNLIVEEPHMTEAIPLVRPSAMREIFLETPKTKWTDIGGQEDVKQKLKESVEWPLTHPETFKRLGIIPAKGVLLYGPPGCSKTLTAKALATEAGLNFMAVKGPELYNKYVGEAERALREIFRKARAASPSIIFFDEIDALSGSRSSEGSGEGSSDRILTTLLNEIDGVEDLINVTILAATNRPDVIDPALLRPGRLDRLLYVGPPDLHARLQILRIQTSRMSISPLIDLEFLASQTDGCSGAEVVALCRDAGLLAMQDDLDATQIGETHFNSAVGRLKRGITPEMIEFYETFSQTFSQ